MSIKLYKNECEYYDNITDTLKLVYTAGEKSGEISLGTCEQNMSNFLFQKG